MSLDQPLAVLPDRGRVFETSWPVRTGDIDAAKRLRLDGIARYLQDAGLDNLEAVDAADSHPLWIVRRTVIDIVRPAVWPERVHLRRWCSGLSTRWTNMRVQIEGEKGALIETEGFWIHISAETGMPTRIEDGFIDALGESANETRLKWKRWLVENAPSADEEGVEETAFTLRRTDIDPFDHVNNAVYWQAVEELLADHEHPGGGRLVDNPHRAVLEYLAPIVSTDKILLRARRDDTSLTVWFLVDDTLRAVAKVGPLSV
ncbi:acyl-[acyl-carrier-protein] thioesterase [Rhodococcus tibetensis]|uniref:Thioesterase n=1 Tax=Rhodococcus tibetensis TaxID=2965064 RepID=A0ABT1QG63_9NOCA|nr:acyl-ACP thioesterase domain-containing protein [Rhodococcus sp. FXJ9.536]MCQ4121266.1 thioesterase [Rhodococcus sp. FXJ9.536]